MILVASRTLQFVALLALTSISACADIADDGPEEAADESSALRTKAPSGFVQQGVLEDGAPELSLSPTSRHGTKPVARLEGRAGDVLTVKVRSLTPTVWPKVAVLDASGAELQSAELKSGRPSDELLLHVYLPKTGTYFVSPYWNYVTTAVSMSRWYRQGVTSATAWSDDVSESRYYRGHLGYQETKGSTTTHVPCELDARWKQVSCGIRAIGPSLAWKVTMDVADDGTFRVSHPGERVLVEGRVVPHGHVVFTTFQWGADLRPYLPKPVLRLAGKERSVIEDTL